MINSQKVANTIITQDKLPK